MRQNVLSIYYGKGLIKSDKKLNPSLSLGCMLTLRSLQKALPIKLPNGSGVNKEIEKEVFTTHMNCSSHRSIGGLRATAL